MFTPPLVSHFIRFEMDSVLQSIELAGGAEEVDLSPIHSISSIEEARQYLEQLLDIYNGADGTAREEMQKQSVMRCIVAILEVVQQRLYGGAPPRSIEGVLLPILHRDGDSRGMDHLQDTAWQLADDDVLLLAMFLNEAATTTQQLLFRYISSAVIVFFQLAIPRVYTAAVMSSSEEAETRASVVSELQSLRLIIAKRLTTSVVELRSFLCYRDATRCLSAALWSLLLCIENAEAQKAAVAAVDELLSPVYAPLQEQLNPGSGRGTGAATTGSAVSAASSSSSPLLLTSIFQYFEDILWATLQLHQTFQKRDGGTEGGKGIAELVCHFISSLLGFCQQYIAHRQQRPVGDAEDTGRGAGGSGSGGYGSKHIDVFRVYHVQHSIQRLLSVGLHLHSCTKSGLLPVSLLQGLQAAVSAFGGEVVVFDPYITATPANVLRPPLQEPAFVSNDDDTVDAAERKEAATWLQTDGENGRLRECRSILAPLHTATVDGGMGGADVVGDVDLLYDEEVALLGRREPLLKSSLGPVTASALVDMVMLSVSRMDYLSEDAIHELHRQGLETMQLTAAYAAQREEVEKQRQMERQGVEAIAPGKLIEHVKDSVALHARGTNILRRVSARAKLERAAFSSILSSYAFIRGEAEATVRQTQALIGRCLVQMPPSLLDSAMDELLLQLRRELARAQRQKEAAVAAAAKASSDGVPPPARPAGGELAALFSETSYYQLTLQVLFMYFAAQAPMADRSAMWGLAALNGLHVDEESSFGGAAGSNEMRTEATLSIQADSPIAFLFEDDVNRVSQDIGQKRSREADDAGHGELGGGLGDDDDGLSGGNDFCFHNDSAAAPSLYSHVLCRVIELIRATKLNLILLDVLLQAPVLTRYFWYYLYRQLCLSTDKASCVIGMWLLRNIAVRRPVYRACAVNILLQLCLSTHDYARRFAIREVDKLLSSTTTSGKAVLDAAAEEQLLLYAKKHLYSIPAYHRSSTGSRAGVKRQGGDEDGDAAVPEMEESQSTAAQSREREKMMVVLDRHLGLFLMLCARQPRQLLPSLLDVFQQCVERGNSVMMELLPANVDVCRMIQHLLKTDPSAFVVQVMPQLRRRCRDARPLVQSLLWAIREQLEAMAQEILTAGHTGVDPHSAAATHALLERLCGISAAVVGHAKAMYELCVIPLGDGPGDGRGADTAAGLPDIRFVVPFLSFLPSSELRQTYLRSFLLFVQVQLQFQRRRQPVGSYGVTAAERSFVLPPAALRPFASVVLRELLVKCPVPFTDGVVRGMTRVDLFVQLHRAPQETITSAASLHGLSSSVGGSGGAVLDGAAMDEAATLGRSGAKLSAEATATPPPLPPISVVTTKEIVQLCFELTRTFDSSTVEKLYGPPELQRALPLLMHPPPVPSQLMATVLLATTIFVKSHYTDFINFAIQTVLIPLERMSVWETDAQLWKGVVLFAECYYRECATFLVNLPDQVLVQALRDHPQLCSQFKEDHENNATFAHILAGL